MGIKKKDLKCMSKNKKCMKCLKSKNSKKFISGKSIKGSTTMFDLYDYGCNKKCKSCKEEEQKGGGLPNVLIPLGLIVAREYGPKLVRSLKRRLTKKGGRKRRRTVRKRRRTRKGKRSRKTLRGGKFGSCSSCQVGGMIMGVKALQRLEEQIRHMLEGTIPDREEAHDILTEMENNTTDRGQQDLAIKIKKNLESPTSPNRKKKGKRTKGKRKRTKGKQRGGFMRGATRNFCTMKN